jgi:hypothetical protein
MFIDNFLKGYIREQWVIYRRVLNEPRAREEVLGFGGLYFYGKDMASAVPVYQDSECMVMHCNPLLADSYGEFPPVHFEDGTRENYRVELRNSGGGVLVSCDLANDFEL